MMPLHHIFGEAAFFIDLSIVLSSISFMTSFIELRDPTRVVPLVGSTTAARLTNCPLSCIFVHQLS